MHLQTPIPVLPGPASPDVIDDGSFGEGWLSELAGVPAMAVTKHSDPSRRHP